MVFLWGMNLKNPHENPINSDTMKNRFSIHGFFIVIKKPWKKHGRLYFISWHFHGFFVCESFFMGHEALNIEGIFMFFFIAIIPTHFLCQMLANPPGVEFLGTISKLRKRNWISSSLVTSPTKREIRHFHVVVVEKRAKKCKKPILYLTFLMLSASLDLKVPIFPCNLLEGSFVVSLVIELTEVVRVHNTKKCF